MSASDAKHSTERSLAALAIGAVGVVYGDVGTSPLYTMKEVFGGTHPVPVSPESVFGILSLIFWSIVLVISVKYAWFIMRADNRGEGGTMALIALVLRGFPEDNRKRWLLMGLGIFGASLFYGDGMITPAISVLSAVEGLEIATPALKPFVLPITAIVIVGLFAIQSRGTGKVGVIFGPVMCLWFASLAVLGLVSISRAPQVLSAVNPMYAIGFFIEHKGIAFLALGAVVLCLTGAEALYADMGHFGRKPIAAAWFGMVMPALLLNYFGQGALILSDPASIQNPFYLMLPSWGLYPMVALSTLATVIASQAVISGAFSLTRQAIQLGYLPRMEIRHTSSEEIGQVYVPLVNWSLLVAVLALVFGFGSSTNLAAAYGIAVTGDMMITSVLATVVFRTVFKWNWFKCAAFLGTFLAIDLAFFSANSVKIPDGGWFPLAAAAGIFTVLATWKRGRQLLFIKQKPAMSTVEFIAGLAHEPLHRVEGAAVFLTANPGGIPFALLHNLSHNKVLHERVVLLTVVTRDVPEVPPEERVDVKEFSEGFWEVKLFFGFRQRPDVPQALALCKPAGLAIEMMQTSFFLSRESLVPTMYPGMAMWREHLFIAMARNAGSAAAFFNIPTNRVVELGAQIEI